MRPKWVVAKITHPANKRKPASLPQSVYCRPALVPTAPQASRRALLMGAAALATSPPRPSARQHNGWAPYESGAAMNHEGDVLCELMSCRPNSLDGILALLNHLGQPEFLIYGREGTDMTILQQTLEIAKEEGQAFPLTLEATLRDVIIAICRPRGSTKA
jgi:hypothetical protein